MILDDTDWERLDSRPAEVELVEITSDWGTASTYEVLFYDLRSHQVYRMRAWESKPRGEVWFLHVGRRPEKQRARY